MKDWKKITRFVQLHQLYDYSLINIILFSVIIRLVGPFHGFFFFSHTRTFFKKKSSLSLVVCFPCGKLRGISL